MNLDEQRVCNPDLGCGLVAGWGPSGAEPAAGLRLVLRRRCGDQLVRHDVGGHARPRRTTACGSSRSTSAPTARSRTRSRRRRDSMPWFSEYPVRLLPRRHDAVLDRGRVAALARDRRRGAAARAVAGPAEGLGVVPDDRDRRRRAHREHDAAASARSRSARSARASTRTSTWPAVWVAAIDAMREMAGARWRGGARGRGARRSRDDGAPHAQREVLDRAGAGTTPSASSQSGRTNDTLTVWPATAAAFGVFDRSARRRRRWRRSRRTALTTDWGARMLADDEPALRSAALQQGRGVAVRHRVRRAGALSLRPPVGRLSR